MKHQNKTMEDNVNKIFTQFKDKNVIVDLKDNNQCEGKVITIDNYLNIVIQNDDGIHALKGGNIILISIKD